MLRGVGAGLLIVASASCTTDGPDASDTPTLHTSFDTTSEGWTLQGFNTDAPVYTPDPQLNGGVTYDGSDGSLMRTDLVGVTDYFQAAAPFLGGLGAYANGTLSFTIREGDTQMPVVAPLVLFVGAGVTWKYDAARAASTSAFTVQVPLHGAGWTRVDGTTASDDDLAASLAKVTSLWLRGEYSSAIESSWLDDVTLTP